MVASVSSGLKAFGPPLIRLLKKEEKDIKRDTETQRIRRAAEEKRQGTPPWKT